MKTLPNDVSRCAGRTTFEGAPTCERRDTCLRYVTLIRQPLFEVHNASIAMHLCTDEQDMRIAVESSTQPAVPAES